MARAKSRAVNGARSSTLSPTPISCTGSRCFAASATRRQVIAGPAEATAAGNVLLQALALGHLQSLAALRQIVRDSFALQTFEPLEVESWQAAYQRFLALTLAT